MSNKLEISNWNQLVSAKSDYPNLRIVVKQFNGDDLTGTQILIVDYNNNNVYFSGFVKNIHSTLIPIESVIDNDDMIDIINNFGFNVALSEPIVLANEVVTILKGYYAQGYRYVYRDYPRCHSKHKTCIYVSDIIDKRFKDPVISNSPDFIPDMWDWCEPFKTYYIEHLIETGTVNNGLPI